METSPASYLVGSLIAAAGLIAAAYVTVDAKHDREAAAGREQALANELSARDNRIRELQAAATGGISTADCASQLQQAQQACIPRADYEAKVLQLQQECIPRSQCQPQADSAGVASTTRAASQDSPATSAAGIAQDGLSFSAPACRAAGGRTRCDFSIINQDPVPRRLALFYHRSDRGAEARSYLVTSAGEQIYGIGSSLGASMAEEGRFERVPQQELEPRVPLRASLTFKSAPQPGSSLTLVAIYVLDDGINRKATFRSIPVVRSD